MQSVKQANLGLCSQVQGLSLSVANNVLGVVGSDVQAQQQQPAPESTFHSNSHSKTASRNEPIQPLVLSRCAWQCGQGFQLLSKPAQVSAFDFSAPLADVQGQATLLPTASGTCHAVMMWLDYRLTPSPHSPAGQLHTTEVETQQGAASQAQGAGGRPGGVQSEKQDAKRAEDEEPASEKQERAECEWIDNAPCDIRGLLRFEAGAVAVALLPVPQQFAVGSGGAEKAGAGGMVISALFHCSDGEMDVQIVP